MSLYRIRVSILALTILSISGCLSVGPEYDPPVLDTWQDAWIAGDSAVLAPGALDQTDWWRSFDDAPLIALVEEADASNPDIDQTRANIAAAEAAVAAARASRFPLGQLTGAITRQKQSSSSLGADVPFEFSAQTLYSAGAEASWEADLFGRVANNISQAEAALGGREAIAADTRRAIMAQTASTYLTLRELDTRIAVNTESLERQSDVLDLTRQLRDAGEVADIDVERQTNLVQSTQAGILAIKAARAETLAGLARLTGHTVPAFIQAHPQLAPFESTALAPVDAFEPIAIASPVDLLRRRPDIRAAERQLAAATYAVSAEMADLYPTISLSGQATFTSNEPSSLFTEEALGYSFGPRISWGIFNLPLTRAQIDQAEAEADAARAGFESAVLQALTETDAALQAYNYAVEEAALRARALGAAERALDLIEIRYREGAESLLSLIDAQRQTLSARDAEAQARYEALRRRVTIYRAFGG
ncbi:MAG: efflux transporter outer membrane subunit [Henriciella sp.]|uniref:efflux transporter outer membrane subunit n=1 Tax=Henriciella sp. TaxID=1968823 RepID=UPI003C768E19